MSASVLFPNGKKVIMWNSTFRILHYFLERRSATHSVAKRILDSNPIAAEIKHLSVEALNGPEIQSFIELVSELLTQTPNQGEGWRTPEAAVRFREELDAVIAEAQQVSHHLNP